MRKSGRFGSEGSEATSSPSRFVGPINTRRRALDDGNAPNSWIKLILHNHIENAHSSNDHFAKSQLARARKQQESDVNVPRKKQNLNTGTPTANSFVFEDHNESPTSSAATRVVLQSDSQQAEGSFSLLRHTPGRAPITISQPIDIIRYRDRAIDVPAYTHHLQLQKNIVTENINKLNFNPNEIQFDNPQWSLKEYEGELKEHFVNGLPEKRAKPLIYAQRAKYLRPFILKALKELECPVEHILRYILDPLPDFPAKRKQRELANKQGVGPLSDEFRWATVLSKLPVSTHGEQDIAGAVCEAFATLTRYSIWYLVRDVSLSHMHEPLSSSTQPLGMCRLCFRFSCTAHGEFLEERQHTAKRARTSNANACSPNFRTSVSLDRRKNRSDTADGIPAQGLELRKTYKYWTENLQIFAGLDQEFPVNYARGHYYPCDHEGACESSDCPCFKAGTNCEKFCKCSQSCVRRFPGCNCHRRSVTCSKERCLCRRMDRECDPDICIKCGAAEAFDHTAEAHSEDVVEVCSNVGIQRGIPKRMLLGTSQVSGFGLFMGETAKGGDFLAEYKGELISKGEANRRKILHQYLREYLFESNMDQQIDGLYAGNKLRFVNNACNPENINCDPIPMFCNGTIRMGLFATRDLQPGDELFFQYGYTEGQMVGFKEPIIQRATKSKLKEQLQQKLQGTTIDQSTTHEAERGTTTTVIPALALATESRTVIEDSDAPDEDSFTDSIGV